MAPGHLVTVEIRDADLIFPQTLTMSMREVPSCYGSHANNTTKGLRSGSIISVTNPTCQPTINMSQFIAKQVPYQPDLYLKHEANVKTLLFDMKMMVSLLKLTVPFCCDKTTITVRQSKSLEDRELVSNLRPCGERWLISSKFSSLMMMKVHLSSQRSTPAHKSSALRIEETGLENLCSNLPLLEADSCLHLLHLTCVFLVFLVKCCNGFSLKPAQALCDGRSLASPLCRRLAGRGAFFCGFPFRWVLRFVLSLTRCLTVQDTLPCSWENFQNECGRPCDNLSCLFFTALWLQQSQPILVQETWQPKDIDLTCYKTLPTKSMTCLQVAPMSLEWPVAVPAASDPYSPSSTHEDPNGKHPVAPFHYP